MLPPARAFGICPFDCKTALPGGRGFEAISGIRRRQVDVILIAVTRSGHKDIWPKVAEACGATQYVAGPVSASKLVNAVAEEAKLH